jgi:urea transport system permease protein
MVIFTAVGGRMSLIGAVYGALIVDFAKTFFSESFPALWLFLMGGLFIAVVMLFPNGLAGIYSSHIRPKFLAWRARRANQPPAPPPNPEPALETPPRPAERPPAAVPRSLAAGIQSEPSH